MSSHNDASTTTESANRQRNSGAVDHCGSTCQSDLDELRMQNLLQIASRPADMHQVGQKIIAPPDDTIRIKPKTRNRIP